MQIERTLQYIVLTAVFVVPFLALYVSNSMFFPFITGKNFAFRILVEIAASGWLALALVNPAYRPQRTWLLWAFGAFVILIGISDLLGVYAFKSMWSNFERMEGWITLAHLFAYFVVTVSVLNTEKLWRAWWYTTLGVSAIVGLIGVFQLFGWVPINQSGSRLDARLGNATYAGIYMLFHIFMAAFFLARTWVNEPRNRKIAAWLFGSLIALNSTVLFFTATRGAILGLLGGAAFSALLLVVCTSDARARRYASIGIIGLIVLAGAFWMVRDSSFVRSVDPLYRLATLFDGTVSSRFMNWGMAWEGIKERPVLGWGQENYAAVFDKYYDPDMWGQEPWFDRVHNIILDWLIAGGVLGLLAYLSLYVFALLMLWRSEAFAPYERAILTGLFAGYFFYNLFTFDNITSYILFVSTLAYISVRSQGDAVPQRSSTTESKAVAVSLGALVLAVVLVWCVNADAIRQNRLLIQAIQPQTGGASRNLELFKEALAISSVGNQETREQLSHAAIAVVNTQDQPIEIKQQFLQTAVEALEKQIEDSPHTARAPFFLGILLDHAGAYEEAKAALEKAHALSPRKQSILFELGLNAFARNAPQEAVAYFREAYELAPAYRDARIYYVAALVRVGDDAAADAVLQPLIDAGTAADQRLANAYAQRGAFGNIIEIWTGHIEKNPQDAQARFLLAAAYYEAGNAAAAIRILEEAKAAIPSAAADADQLILQVRGGVQAE
ncbi:MAG TPA: O-antigen ligase family protein [Candidatus Paceibacterota bacterium]|nr:O-antigen ligase family protein [Candidatus Paceibacterota bacterium]